MARDLLSQVKTAVRLKSSTFDEDELKPLICACKADLKNGGVAQLSEAKPLVRRAIVLYCKAHFGYDDNQSVFLERYEKLKNSMASSDEYGEHAGG